MSTKELTAEVEKVLPALMVDRLKEILTRNGEGFYRDGCIAQLSRQARRALMDLCEVRNGLLKA